MVEIILTDDLSYPLDISGCSKVKVKKKVEALCFATSSIASLEVEIAEGASFYFVSFLKAIDYSLFVTLKRDAVFNLCDFVVESSRRGSIDIKLLEHGAKAELFGLFFLKKEFTANVRVSVGHLAAKTSSFELFKGIVQEKSSLNLESLVFIDKKALFSESNQISKGLILSDFATANFKPSFKILSDETSAHHGSSVSMLKPEELFYLRSRAISCLNAQKLLIYGFCKEIVDKVRVDSIKEGISTCLT